jgi:hypothetical protein
MYAREDPSTPYLSHTDPHDQHMDDDQFAPYWFGHTAIVLLKSSAELTEDRKWNEELLGTYYVGHLQMPRLLINRQDQA